MNKSHAMIAAAGSFSIHAALACAIMMSSLILPKPDALREVVITQLTLMEEPKAFVEHKPEVPQVEPTPLEPQKQEPKPVVKVVQTPKKSIVPPKPTPITPLEAVHETVPAEPQETVAPPLENTAQASRQTIKMSEDAMLSYLGKVRSKIQAALRYPSMAKKMGLEGETVVQFMIHTNGMVDASSIKIAKSSGKSVLDKNAVDAVLEALPFETPPHDAIEIKIPVVFKLTS